MIRLASFLILVGLVPVARALWEPTGPTAIGATFFGAPCVAAGILVYLLARLRERGPAE